MKFKEIIPSKSTFCWGENSGIVGGETRLVGEERESFWSVGEALPPIHQLENTLIVILSGKTFLREETLEYFTVFGQNRKITFLFWCWMAKIRSGKILQNWWITKLTSSEILYKFVNCKNLSFFHKQCLLNCVFSRPSTISVICFSKKVLKRYGGSRSKNPC